MCITVLRHSYMHSSHNSAAEIFAIAKLQGDNKTL